MKRMIKYAVDHGFDRVAWTPGDVQADRYDLSKHVDRIEYEPTEEAGTYEIAVYDKAGKQIIHEDEVGLDRIEDMVGKELAQKIADDAGEPMKDRPARDWRVLSGVDLKVGGEGMKTFYDKMLPNEVQKLVGKFGAKVDNSEISTGPREAADRDTTRPDAQARADHDAAWNAVTDQIRAIEDRQPPGTGNTPETMRLYDQLDVIHARMMDETLARMGTEPGPTQSVHSFEITPQLRDAARTQGLPLFSPRIAVRNERETERWTPSEP
ncbi:MAG: hypothetical protein ABSC06_39820 [Rhodopila sp.]